MSKLGDLIVRLRLQYDDYKKGLKKADADTKGFAGTLGKIKGVGLAVWGAIGGAVTAFATQFVQHSQTMSDKWNLGVNQMKAVWSQFLTTLTSWDWEGFGDRIKAAMGAAAESTLAHDAEFEVQNSLKLRKAAMSEELAQLQILMRDTGKSYEARAKAAQEYLDKVRPLYEAETELRKRIYMTDTDEYLKNAGLQATADNRDLLRKFFTDIAPNESLMSILNEYQKKVQGKKNYQLSQEDYKALDAFYAQYGNKAGAALSVLAQYYQSTNDDIANKVVEAIFNYDKAIALFAEETRRIQTLENSALAQIAKSTDANIADLILDQAVQDMEAATNADIEQAMKQVDSALNEYAGKFKELAGSDAQVIEFAKFKLPDINTTDIEQALREVEAIIDNYNEILSSVDGEMSLSIDITGLKEALAEAENLAEGYRHTVGIIEQASYMLEDAIVQSTAGGMQAFTDMLMGLEGADPTDVLAALLQPFAQTCTQLGAILVAESEGIKAFKQGLANLDPKAPLVAGIALIALGAALGSAIRALGGSGSSSSGSNGGYDSGGSSAAGQNYESTLTVEVTGKISGSDIVISGNKTNDKWNR